MLLGTLQTRQLPLEKYLNCNLSSSIGEYLFHECKKRVAIRIPKWSTNTVLYIYGTKKEPSPGKYWVAEKTWNKDTIELNFDFTPYYLEGGRSYKGKKSIYIGPTLYGMDIAVENDEFDMDHLPPISHNDLLECIPTKRNDGRMILKLPNGLVLSDFSHLGSTGSNYITWFVCN